MAYISFSNSSILGRLADSDGERLAFPAVLAVTCPSAGSLCQCSVYLDARHGNPCRRDVSIGGADKANLAPSDDHCFRGRHADSSSGRDAVSRSHDECHSTLKETSHWRGDRDVYRINWICEQRTGCSEKRDGGRTRCSLQPANPGFADRLCGHGMPYDSRCSRCSGDSHSLGFGCGPSPELCVWTGSAAAVLPTHGFSLGYGLWGEGAMFGGFCNSSGNTLYIDGAAGISEGGRTGLTTVFVGCSSSAPFCSVRSLTQFQPRQRHRV